MDHLTDIKDYLRILVDSEHFNLLLVQGPPGWGKTSLLRTVLARMQVPYRLLGAYATPLALFNGLVEDAAGLLVIDDSAGLFHNQLAMAVLNAATWPGAGGDGGRRVIWTSTTEKAAAEAVDYKGKIVVLTNALPQTPAALAFKNRALLYRLDVSRERVAGLLLSAAQSTDHFADTARATEVAEYLGQQTQYHDAHDISLRTLRLGYELATATPERWRELLAKALPNSSPEQTAQELASSTLSVEQQATEFQRRTNLGRRKFFYIRETLGLGSSKTPKSRNRAPKPKDRPQARVTNIRIAQPPALDSEQSRLASAALPPAGEVTYERVDS